MPEKENLGRLGDPIKIAFIAPTGYGKTTATQIIHEKFSATVNIKLAAPLYEFQELFFRRLGVNLETKQDGELLQFLGYKVQKEVPLFLAQEFQKTYLNCIPNTKIITNDDCRQHNYEYLKSLGFRFVSIKGCHRQRDDHVLLDKDHPVEQGMDDLHYDYLVNNTGDIPQFTSNVVAMTLQIGAEYYDTTSISF